MTHPTKSTLACCDAGRGAWPGNCPNHGETYEHRLLRRQQDQQATLELVPITQTEAKDFVERHHRHSIPPLGSVFQIGLTVDGEEICGVAIVGRPVARALDADPYTAEVLRLCTDGTDNACSKLYAACWRAARAMGYRKLITYTLQRESGSSLKAAGFAIVGEVTKRSWNTPSRPRVNKDERQERFRWEITA